MPETTTQAKDAVKLDTSPTMAMTTLYGAAIGPIGSDYYLPIFERFEAAGQGTFSWNWSACLYNLNWMCFRGLWRAALAAAAALAGATLVLVAVGRLVFDWPPDLLYGLLLACLALVFLVPGAWGNALLYNHSRAAMMTAVANNKTLTQACTELSQHASSRLRFIRILVANLALIALAGLAYVMLPSNNPPAIPASPEPQTVLALYRASRPTSATEAAVKAEPPASTTERPTSGVAPVASAPASASALSVTSAASAAPQALLAASAPAQASSKAISAPAVAASKEPPLPQPAADISAESTRRTQRNAVMPPQSAAHIGAKSTASAPAVTEGVYVNAGLFADRDNARRTVARLIEVGLPATAQELQTSHGTRTRVRVGPFPNRNRAELAVRHIKAMNLDAVLAKP